MAPENAESHSVPPALGESVEPIPDSGAPRVSLDTHFESGIPPARQPHESDAAALLTGELTIEDGARRTQTALANALRTELNLGLLVRSLKHVAAGAEVARKANVELMQELDELRAALGRSEAQERALAFRMHQLEQLLTLIRHETASERQFLIEEQDRFLREILTDHERQLNELRQRIRDVDRGQAETIAELTTQRDQAREYATRCERERDLAWEELASGVAPPTERMQRSPSTAALIGTINLRSLAVATSATNTDERASERPTTSYSVSGDDIREE